MIKHIVFFKLENPSKEIKGELKSKLMSLKDEITIIQHLEVGINFNKGDRAYDLSLITDFNSVEDLNTYANHSLHVEVIKYIKSLNAITKVVDYQY